MWVVGEGVGEDSLLFFCQLDLMKAFTYLQSGGEWPLCVLVRERERAKVCVCACEQKKKTAIITKCRLERCWSGMACALVLLKYHKLWFGPRKSYFRKCLPTLCVGFWGFHWTNKLCWKKRIRPLAHAPAPCSAFYQAIGLVVAPFPPIVSCIYPLPFFSFHGIRRLLFFFVAVRGCLF